MEYKIKFEVQFFLKDEIKGFNKTSKALKKYLHSYKKENGLPSTEEKVDILVDKVINLFPDKISYFKIEKVYVI